MEPQLEVEGVADVPEEGGGRDRVEAVVVEASDQLEALGRQRLSLPAVADVPFGDLAEHGAVVVAELGHRRSGPAVRRPVGPDGPPRGAVSEPVEELPDSVGVAERLQEDVPVAAGFDDPAHDRVGA